MRHHVIELLGLLGFLAGFLVLCMGAFGGRPMPSIAGAILMIGSLLVCEAFEEMEA